MSNADYPTEAEIVTDPILRFFAYAHLPIGLRVVAVPFSHTAACVVRLCPRNPERTVALRGLLDARYSALRATELQLPL